MSESLGPLRAAALAICLVLTSCGLLSSSEPDGRDGSPGEPGEPGQPGQPGQPGSSSADAVVGSGVVEIEDRQVSGFDSISFSGVADLFVEVADVEELSVEAEDNLLPLLTSEVRGNTLVMGIRPNTSIRANRPIVYRLKVPGLKRIEASGSTLVDLAGLDEPRLRLEVSGAADVVLSGSAGDQTIEVSGTGNVDARDLRGRVADVMVSGTAEVIVNVSERLDADVSGTGIVRYLRSPEVSRTLTGLGRVEAA